MIQNVLLYPYAALCRRQHIHHNSPSDHITHEAFFTFWSKKMFTHLGSDKRPAPQKLLYVMGGAALQGFGSGEH